MFRKGIALCLALCLLCSLIPFAAAEEGEAAMPAPICESTAEATSTEDTVLAQAPSTDDCTEEDPLSVLPLAQEPAATRTVTTYTTTLNGKIFIAKLQGHDISASMVAPAEQIVNTFLQNFSVSISQTQFDALVSLAYDCPGAFTNGITNREDKNRFELCLMDGDYTDAAFADALCGFVRSNGYISEKMVNCRVREAKLFLHADYEGTAPATFYSVIFYPNGGKAPRSVCCYAAEESYGSLPVATKSNKNFAGWYSDLRGGSHISNSVAACSDIIVYARWNDSVVSNPNEKNSNDPASGRSDGISLMQNRSSDALISFIQGHEGFVHFAVWDYAQYSIGYGSRVDKDDYPDGIHEREADRLMRWMLYETFEASVSAFAEKNKLTLKQNEYDALVSFSYNVGPSWTSGCRLATWLKNRTDTMELVNAMGVWCSAGGEILPGLVYRRMDEAEMFLYGDYARNNGGRLYQAIQFRANGGTLGPESKIIYFTMGSPYGAFPSVYYEGHTLTGWTDKNGRDYAPTQAATGDLFITLYAQWKEGDSVIDPPPPPDPPKPMTFPDVQPSDWFYSDVTQICLLGLFSGLDNGTFSPNTSMTRAMLVSVLHRLSGESASYSPVFSDVEEGSWYADSVTWAYNNKIVSGVGNGKFAPNNSITREQIATILVNYANYIGEDTSAVGELSGFPDAKNISSWAHDAVSWAVAQGIISGATINGRIMVAPAKTASRAEVASMLWRFLLACNLVE